MCLSDFGMLAISVVALGPFVAAAFDSASAAAQQAVESELADSLKVADSY